MAEELKKFFTCVFTKDSSDHIPYLSEILEQSTDLLELSEKKIKYKIDGLRKDAAACPDGLTPVLLKTMGDSILNPLLLIFKISLLEGKVPREWKSATVVPIHKKGSKREAGNYRPVYLTSIPCKVLESVIKDRMMEHLISNNLIKDTQHGLMPGRSCTIILSVSWRA
jgi:hypothetical protein